MKWYVVTTYSGFEEKAKLSLLERIKQEKFEQYFGEILIPSESVLDIIKGVKKTISRRFYPGYLFIEMELNDLTWHLVKATPKISNFIGNKNPIAMSDREIEKIKLQMQEGSTKPKPRIQFEQGDTIRVVDGPFANMSGTVEEIKPDKQKIKVLVSIFGRPTPVELNYGQVEKT